MIDRIKNDVIEVVSELLSVAKLENELLKALDEYFIGDSENESNTIE